MALTVDAHHHFWDTTSGRFDYYWMGDDLAAIKGVRGPDQLRPLLAEQGIDRLLVQGQALALAHDRPVP
jgi:predicted TIM-barrel fold metal-dependent hydrolase